MAASQQQPPDLAGSVRLTGHFDPYLLGYRDRTVTLTLRNAGAAALPAAAPGDVPELTVEWYDIFTLLKDVGGAITADPVSVGVGHSAVRVPWVLVPRATSDMRPS